MMNDTAFDLVRQSVMEHSMTDDERLLEQLRITSDKKLPEMDFLFRIFDKPCLPRGELVAVTGKAKSGKTLFASMLMVCCVKGEVLKVKRPFTDSDGTPQRQPLRCLWYDTEQSGQSTQDILKNRILRMAASPQNRAIAMTQLEKPQPAEPDLFDHIEAEIAADAGESPSS